MPTEGFIYGFAPNQLIYDVDFPGFVDELNSLLLPEAEIAKPSPNCLTTESRIYALIFYTQAFSPLWFDS